MYHRPTDHEEPLLTLKGVTYCVTVKGLTYCDCIRLLWKQEEGFTNISKPTMMTHCKS